MDLRPQSAHRRGRPAADAIQLSRHHAAQATSDVAWVRESDRAEWLCVRLHVAVVGLTVLEHALQCVLEQARELAQFGLAELRDELAVVCKQGAIDALGELRAGSRESHADDAPVLVGAHALEQTRTDESIDDARHVGCAAHEATREAARG